MLKISQNNDNRGRHLEFYSHTGIGNWFQCFPVYQKKTRVFTTGTLCLWSGDFPQSQQSVVEKKAWVSTRRTCVFKSAISSVCSFVASRHCVTQRDLASLHFIVSCEPIREAVTSMLATSRVTNQMPRSIWATPGKAVLWAACGIYGLRQFQNCYVVPYFVFKE